MPSTIKTLLACGSLEKNVKDDTTSVGDVDRAFCKKSILFGPEDRRRFVCHRCRKTGISGSTLGLGHVWELRGGVYTTCIAGSLTGAISVIAYTRK